jgi:hypothetical protein
LSAVARPSPKLLTAFACFELTWFCYERLQDWTVIHSPDARTSHLRTLSKIVGIGLSASSLCLFPVAAEASEGAAHYRVVFVAVNTPLRFFFLASTRRSSPRRSHILTGPDVSVNTCLFVSTRLAVALLRCLGEGREL